MAPLRVQARLVRRLQLARSSLVAWDASIEAIAPGSGGDALAAAREIQATRDLLTHARQSLDQRLAKLGIPVPASATPKPRPPRKAGARVPVATVAWRVCIDACRACGRVLGAAYRVARSVADGLSANVLYAALRDLEKQLWVLTPHHA